MAVNIIPVLGQAVSAALVTAVGALTAASVITAVTVMAISYGVSLWISGLEFKALKEMLDEHYQAGLKNLYRR